MKRGYVYIVSNKRDGTLYIGVTSNLSRRVWEHREGLIERYGLKRLVSYEPYEAREEPEALAAHVEACADPRS